MKKAIFHLICSLFLFCLPSFSQDNSFTGYAIATVNQDSILQINTFGYADSKQNSSYTENTVQPIGSVSKTFIGIALMIAKEKGLIDLDADINTYLDFKIVNPYIKEKNSITLRHLATHTSGIIDEEEIYENSYTLDETPKHSLHDFFLTNLSINKKNVKKSFYKSKAGERYSYSNVGAALAAYIIEKTSGIPFDEFTNETIFTPLKMTNTGWFTKDIAVSKQAILYDEKDNPLQTYSFDTYPDGSLKTTITDLSHYLIELIKGYNGNSTLLKKESWEEFYSKSFIDNQIPINRNEKEPNIGVFVVHFKSGNIGHTGSDLGVSSFLMFNPEDNIGKLFMANEDITKNNVESFKTIWKSF